MTEQLALDVAARPVPRPQGVVVTALQLAAVARLTREQAREYLVDFEERGIVERVAGGWRFTARGRAIAVELTRWAGSEADE